MRPSARTTPCLGHTQQIARKSCNGTSLRLLLAAVLLGFLLTPAAAQRAGIAPADLPNSKLSETKKEKFKCEVLLLTRQAITVRDQQNYNLVRTFTYNEKLAVKVSKMFDQDRLYQYGDKVEIEFLAGTHTAVDIDGKPSRPPRP